MMTNGVAPFNGGLFGTVTIKLYSHFIDDDGDLEMWIIIFVGSVFRFASSNFKAQSDLKVKTEFLFSIFICKALSATLGKFNLPYLTLPFNILSIIIFLAMGSRSNSDRLYKEEIQWDKVFIGVGHSMGQVGQLSMAYLS